MRRSGLDKIWKQHQERAGRLPLLSRFASDDARMAEFDDWHRRSTGTDLNFIVGGKFISQRVSTAELARAIGMLNRWPRDWLELCVTVAGLPQPTAWNDLAAIDPTAAARLMVETVGRCPGPDCDGAACADCAHETLRQIHLAAGEEIARRALPV